MSYYYNYYLAYKKDGKFYPHGPFDSRGFLCSVLSKSRSYASDLHNRFTPIKKEEIDRSLYKSLLTNDCYEECLKANEPYTEEENQKYREVFKCEPEPKKLMSIEEALDNAMEIKYLPVNELPCGNLIKEGYVIASQIGSQDYEDCFYPVLDGHTYAERLKVASMLGDVPEKDVEGENLPKLSEYIYHKWIDSTSEDYEAWILQMMIDTFEEYDGKELYIIETEG